MTFEIFKNYFLSFNFRNGVGLDIEFPHDKPVWITVMKDDGEVFPMVSRFEGMDLLLPFIRISLGRLWEL